MVVENSLCDIEQRKDLRIANGVVNILALLPSTDDASISEHRKLLRQSALFDIESAAEVVDPGFAATEFVENTDAKRVRQSLEKLRLELARLNHCNLIFAYYDMVVNGILQLRDASSDTLCQLIRARDTIFNAGLDYGMKRYGASA